MANVTSIDGRIKALRVKSANTGETSVVDKTVAIIVLVIAAIVKEFWCFLAGTH